MLVWKHLFRGSQKGLPHGGGTAPRTIKSGSITVVKSSGHLGERREGMCCMALRPWQTNDGLRPPMIMTTTKYPTHAQARDLTIAALFACCPPYFL